ncbi:unnamed protein product [Brassica oleracea]
MRTTWPVAVAASMELIWVGIDRVLLLEEQDAYVLCRIFHKNNIGPLCGNIYTPFMEEEWDGEGVALIPVVNVSVRVEPLPVAGVNPEKYL